MHAAHRRTPTAGRVSFGAAKFIAETGCCKGILPALVVVMALAWSGDSVKGHADASLVPISSHRFIDGPQNVGSDRRPQSAPSIPATAFSYEAQDRGSTARPMTASFLGI
jgi:hypothetical protein